MDKVKVVLADDHAILTQGTASILMEYDFIEVVGTACNGEKAMEMVRTKKPDVLIADISMPGKSIFEITEDIKGHGYPTKVLVFSMHNTSDYVFRALNSGVSGYITKFADKEEVIKAIQNVAKGEEYYSQSITQIIVKGFKNRQNTELSEQNPLNVLSKREKEVLSLIVDGLNSKQIAEKLFLSERTVSNHRANMLQKCQVKNTVELVRIYLDNKTK